MYGLSQILIYLNLFVIFMTANYVLQFFNGNWFYCYHKIPVIYHIHYILNDDIFQLKKN